MTHIQKNRQKYTQTPHIWKNKDSEPLPAVGAGAAAATTDVSLTDNPSMTGNLA